MPFPMPAPTTWPGGRSGTSITLRVVAMGRDVTDRSSECDYADRRSPMSPPAPAESSGTCCGQKSSSGPSVSCTHADHGKPPAVPRNCRAAAATATGHSSVFERHGFALAIGPRTMLRMKL